jgi:hypothetical protein
MLFSRLRDYSLHHEERRKNSPARQRKDKLEDDWIADASFEAPWAPMLLPMTVMTAQRCNGRLT